MDVEGYPSPLQQFLQGGEYVGVAGRRQRNFDVVVLVEKNGGDDAAVPVVDDDDDDDDDDADDVEIFDTVAFPRSLLARRDVLAGNTCQVDCHLCDVCVPEVTSSRKVMLSSGAEEASLVIVGLFPERQQQQQQQQQQQEGNNSSFPNITLGAFVLDTCGSKDLALSLQRDIQACRASYTDAFDRDVTIHPSRVVAYVEFKNYGDDSDASTKPVMKITDEEYSMAADSYVRYLQFMADILTAVRWTYLKVVLHDQDVLRSEFHQVLQSRGLCVADEILIRDKNNVSVAAATSRLITKDASAVLFLTDHPTTLRILEGVHSENSSVRLNYVFMPWNSDVTAAIPQSYSIDTAIVTQPVLPDDFHFPVSRDHPDPWRGTLEKFFVFFGVKKQQQQVFTNQSSRLKGLSLVPLAVDNLLRSLEEVYRALCPQTPGVCSAMEDLDKLKDRLVGVSRRGAAATEKEEEGSSVAEAELELDVFALRGRSRVKIGEVDVQSRVHMNKVSIQDMPASECPGWCPRCLSCQTSQGTTSSAPAQSASTPTSLHSLKRSPAQGSSGSHQQQERSSQRVHHPVITIPGDVLIAGIFPVHQAGRESFTCGDLVESLEERRVEEAFLFAVDTAKKRYAGLLPGVEIGGVLLDSCSNLGTALHHLGQFETCETNMQFGVSAGDDDDDDHDHNDPNPPFFSPAQVVGYVLQDSFDTASVLKDTVDGLNKMAAVTSLRGMRTKKEEGNLGQGFPDSPERVTVEAIFALFREFSWSHAAILTSGGEEFMNTAEYFLDEAGYRGVCVVRYLQLIPGASNVRRVAEILSEASSSSSSSSSAAAAAFVPVLLFLSRDDAVALFRDREVGAVTRPWLVSMIGDDWLSTVGINIPLGALLLDVQGKINDDFQVFLEQFNTYTQVPLSPWWRDYLEIRMGCRTSHGEGGRRPPSGELCRENPLLTGPMFPSAAASRVIRGVDSVLHALDARYKSRCPADSSRGICANLSRDITEGRLSLSGASFMYEEGMVSFDDHGDLEVSLSVVSYQPGQLVMTGTYRPSGLSINASLVQFFTPRGQPLPQPRPQSHCPACTCINVVANVTQSPAPSTGVPTALADWLWHEERGVFIREAWAWSVLAVTVVGAVTALSFIFYVMFKVWQGALARRYIGLGLLLLLSITLLYLSSLPFLFTPSPAVCGLRYSLPCVALCLCLGCVLVKLMALQDYRTIGLGGELSGVNQGLSVFFIVLVQVSVSVQWWIFRGPFLEETPDPTTGLPKVSCLFLPNHLALNLVFVLFLLLLCALYSLSVRKEKKNMGEARLLLAGSWVVAVLWVIWLPALLLLPERYASLVTSAGVLGTASALLVVVFVPKVRMVAGLKYDLAKKQAVRNGYSVDTDFLYERPYSLPGTLTSTYSSIRTYPKSVTANFDSSLSY
ncbi:metabotropic glutamate receptor 2-like [Babylonia areolata]|uniref:metabotropic glutamate receptor 2-like n=1 Tax=Babylonia areolata TaxID=304850 RepID=UPI003FCF6526